MISLPHDDCGISRDIAQHHSLILGLLVSSRVAVTLNSRRVHFFIVRVHRISISDDLSLIHATDSCLVHLGLIQT